jgi:hypothetical protein
LVSELLLLLYGSRSRKLEKKLFSLKVFEGVRLFAAKIRKFLIGRSLCLNRFVFVSLDLVAFLTNSGFLVKNRLKI